MLLKNLRGMRRIPKSDLNLFDGQGAVLIVFGFFLAGAVVGAFVGSISVTRETAGILGGHIDAAVSPNLLQAIWTSGRFLLVACICASSLLGVVAVPAMSAVRGYLISCSAAAFYSCYPDTGLKLVFTIIALPALLALPAFFLISADSLNLSRKLLVISGGKKINMPNNLARHIPVCLIFVILAAVLETYAVPVIISSIR